jgi:hypothetical protein
LPGLFSGKDADLVSILIPQREVSFFYHNYLFKAKCIGLYGSMHLYI